MQQGNVKLFRWTGWIAPVACAVSLFYLLCTLLLAHLWGDQAFLLYAAREVLHGVKLDGPQLVETNPPMVVWFSMLPVMLSEILPVKPALALELLNIVIIGGSALWCARLLRNARVALIASSTAMAAVLLLLMLTIQPTFFGQKEQIMLALVMPLLVVLASGGEPQLGVPMRVLVGMAAGLGICFKPQHMLVIVAAMLFVVLYERSLRGVRSVALWTSVATCSVYVVCVRMLTPYMDSVVPWLKSTYWALAEVDVKTIALRNAAVTIVPLLLLCCVWVVLRGRMRAARFSGVFLAAAAGALAAFLQQGMGWGYQRFPVTALLLMAAAWMVLDLLTARDEAKPGAMAWVGALAVAVALFFPVAMKVHRQEQRPQVDSIDSELQRMQPGTPVYIFSTQMSQFRVILAKDLMWSGRFAHLWMLPAVVQNEYPRVDAKQPFHPLPQDVTEQIAYSVREDVVEDFHRTPPKFVFVERCDGPRSCVVYNHAMDYVAWFGQDADFAAEWQHYTFVRRVANFDEYARR